MTTLLMDILTDNGLKILSHNICDKNGSFSITGINLVSNRNWYGYYYKATRKVRYIKIHSVFLDNFNTWLYYDGNSSFVVGDLKTIHVWYSYWNSMINVINNFNSVKMVKSEYVNLVI